MNASSGTLPCQSPIRDAAAPPRPSPWRRHRPDTHAAQQRWALEWLPSATRDGAPAGGCDNLRLQLASQDIVNLRGVSARQRHDVLGILSGQTEPVGSTIRIAGVDPWQLSPQERRSCLQRVRGCATVDDILSPGISVRDNLALPLLLNEMPPHAAFGFVDTELTLLGLVDCADRLPRHLSPSEYHRTVLGRACIHCPRLLVYAAPHTELSAVEVALVRHRLWLAAHQQGCAVLMSTEQPELTSLALTSVWPRWPLLAPVLVQFRDAS